MNSVEPHPLERGMNRRQWLCQGLAGLGACMMGHPILAQGTRPPTKLGVTAYSYNQRWRMGPGRGGWKDSVDFLSHVHEIGGGSIQMSLRGWSQDLAHRIRDRAVALGVSLEGQISLPKSEADLTRWKAELEVAREAGIHVLRTVCLSGRRYERFQNLSQWKAFQAESHAALQRALPGLERHRLKLAIENHKDWRAEEFLKLLEVFPSEWLGVNLDFGNNLALLEDPLELAEALASRLFSTHLKDMALAPHERGFLLSEVPLGQGCLDLARMIEICRRANPDVLFQLEMITRDPLQVPVLESGYWITMAQVPATDLARSLRLAGKGDAVRLPSVSGLQPEEVLALEERQIQECFAFARKHLDLG